MSRCVARWKRDATVVTPVTLSIGIYEFHPEALAAPLLLLFLSLDIPFFLANTLKFFQEEYRAALDFCGTHSGRDTPDKARAFLRGSRVKLCSVVGFPLGAQTPATPAQASTAGTSPTNTLAASAPSASICLQRACNALFGSSSLPWRITCGSIGRLPQAMAGAVKEIEAGTFKDDPETEAFVLIGEIGGAAEEEAAAWAAESTNAAAWGSPRRASSP